MQAGGAEAALVEILSSDEELSALEKRWRELYLALTEPRVAQSPEWMRSWWRVFGERYGEELLVLAVRAEGRLVGILPLYRPRVRFPGLRTVRLLSTGEDVGEESYPEGQDLLVEPGFEEVAFHAVKRALLDDPRLRRARFRTGLVRPGSLLARLAREVGREGSRALRPIPHVTYAADLSAGFEAYLSSLGSSTRQGMRRLLRGAESGAFRLADSVAESLSWFDDLVTLHTARWNAEGKPGAFATERARAFHRTLLEKLHPNGEALVASLADRDGSPLVYLYGFLSRGVFEFYQSGARLGDEGAMKSPGITAHLLLMRDLAERGVESYDLLAGDAEYKRRLGREGQPFVDYEIIEGWSALFGMRVKEWARRVAGRGRSS